MPFPKKVYYSNEIENEYNNDNNYGNGLFGTPTKADNFATFISYKNIYNNMNNSSNADIFQNQSDNIFFNSGKSLFGNKEYNNDNLFGNSGGLFGNNTGLFTHNHNISLFG